MVIFLFPRSQNASLVLDSDAFCLLAMDGMTTVKQGSRFDGWWEGTAGGSTPLLLIHKLKTVNVAFSSKKRLEEKI